jgi:hypothetical protein
MDKPRNQFPFFKYVIRTHAQSLTFILPTTSSSSFNDKPSPLLFSLVENNKEEYIPYIPLLLLWTVLRLCGIDSLKFKLKLKLKLVKERTSHSTAHTVPAAHSNLN